MSDIAQGTSPPLGQGTQTWSSPKGPSFMVVAELSYDSINRPLPKRKLRRRGIEPVDPKATKKRVISGMALPPSPLFSLTHAAQDRASCMLSKKTKSLKIFT